jgi:uncharacterized protein YciI
LRWTGEQVPRRPGRAAATIAIGLDIDRIGLENHQTDRSAEYLSHRYLGDGHALSTACRTRRDIIVPLYAVIAFDRVPDSRDLREKYRAEHRAYSQANDSEIRLAGAMYDEDGSQCGTLKIFEADSAEAVREWYRREPFFTNAVYREFHVVEWRLALNRFEPREWLRDYPVRVDR